jgi:hypothetical protein
MQHSDDRLHGILLWQFYEETNLLPTRAMNASQLARVYHLFQVASRFLRRVIQGRLASSHPYTSTSKSNCGDSSCQISFTMFVDIDLSSTDRLHKDKTPLTQPAVVCGPKVWDLAGVYSHSSRLLSDPRSVLCNMISACCLFPLEPDPAGA